MSSICLNMIVKNESHIIQKTLANICQHVKLDYWVISDTGSTDNTIDLIEQFFKNKNIPGEIINEPWKNFGHNRNIALQACQGKSDYVLFFDADDRFEGDFILPEVLTSDSYSLNMSSENTTIKYSRKLLIKNNSGFYWRGVLHEFITKDGKHSSIPIKGEYTVISGRKGHRSLDKNKYLKDAKLLEDAILQGTDPDLTARYTFYCAQSYQDAGLHEQAIKWYEQRTKLGDWQEEIYISFMRLGLLYEKQNKIMEALYAWQCGVNVDAQRAECWYYLARLNNWNKNYNLALCYAEKAQKLNIPVGNRLFINKDIYKFWCHYELCINAFQLKYFEQSYAAFKLLIRNANRGLVEKVIHQLSNYQNLIKKDSYQEVSQLIKDLKRLNFENLLQGFNL